jgi:ABC-type Mn2+/Zn2+ transport system permease subunit
MNEMFIIFFLLFVFSVALFAYFEQRVEEFNDFSAIIISAFSLSLGNSVLNENDRIIKDLGQSFYYLVSSGFLRL